MPYRLYLTDSASRDLAEIDEYICTHDSIASADHVLDNIEEVINSLSELPERGAHPKELLELGIREFREVYFKPYRIIYRVMDENIYILLIADGRRDMQSLLSRRLLGD